MPEYRTSLGCNKADEVLAQYGQLLKAVATFGANAATGLSASIGGSGQILERVGVDQVAQVSAPAGGIHAQPFSRIGLKID